MGKERSIVTRGTGPLWTGCRSVCISSCALPWINRVCPVCSLISFCNSFPWALFSVHACLRDKRSQTTGHTGPWFCSVFCRSGCDHREYQAGLASKLAVWPGNQGQGRLSEWGNWRSWLLEEKRDPSELLENQWCCRGEGGWGMGGWA